MRDRILREVPEKRERCVKHFQMTQKGMAAAVYPAPVHYEEDGQWKEIDNRLEAVQEDGREVYRNLASAVRVSFAKESDTKELVTIEKDGKKILWGLSPFLHTKSTRNVNYEGEISTFRVLEKEDFWKEAEMLDMKVSVLEEEESEEDEIRKMMCVPHLNGEGVYEEILPGIDLHYSIQGEQLKENIRLNRKEAAEQELSFQLTHPGMELRSEEDGGLGLYDSENQESGRIFRLVKPYMYDAAGNQSLQVEFQVEIGTESSVIKVVPDREWMQDTERVYPIVIDPMTETSKTKGNIEDTYVFTGGNVPENPGNVYAYGSFVVGRSDELGKMRALLRFRDLPDIGKGSIIYGATMYIWQFEYSSYSNPELPLLAYEVKNSWDEKSVRWGNQPAVDGAILDYKKVKQVINGNTVSITPIGFNVTRLVRQWYNTGKNYGIMVKSKYEDDENLANRAYARFYASDSPSISSEQFPSGVFYYRNVNGLEDYQSYHEQSAGRAGIGYTNDFTGNVVWSHLDVATEGGPMTTEIRHVYNSSEADTSSRMGYGWRLSSQQELKESGIKDYPYVYIDEDGTKHYFYKDTNDGNKLKDEDGLGLTITVTSSSEHDRYRTMETKDKVKYIFGQDGFLRFIEDLNGNSVKHQYGPNSAGNYLGYITDASGGFLNIIYSTDEGKSKITAIQDSKGREIRYGYDAQGNLTSITYPDGSKSQFTYDSSHKLLSVTNPDGYRVNYEYTNDFQVPRVSKVSETGQKNAPGQELKISYENGNTTIFEEPGLDGQMEHPGDNKKTTWHFDNMGRPTDVLDADGFANNYSYYTSGMKNHKLSKDGSVQKTVYGLLRNPTFDPSHGDGGWYTCRMSDGKRGAITHADGYIGTKSAKLTKTELTSEEGICQDVHLSAGTYTLSAYVKTESLNPENQEQGAVVSVIRADRTRIMGERCIDYVTDKNVDDGWERLVLTFQLPAEETISVFVGMTRARGTLLVSGVQLETGNVANELNLIHNPGFERCTNEAPDQWEFHPAASGVKSVMTADKGRCAVLNGQMEQNLHLMQGINITGEEGDIFNLSCWVKGFGIPEKHFSLSAAVIYTDDSVKWHHFQCNPNIKGWQFVSNTFSTDDQNEGAKKTYKAIHVYLMYYNQVNQVLFKGVQLVRDDGESYQYDDDGNLINAVSAAEKESFSYDKKGSLTKMGSVDGTGFEYRYDTKNHLTQAANSEGVRYRFTYNDKGQPIRMTADGGKHLGAVIPGRVYYIREKVSGNYLDVRNSETANGTVVQLCTFFGFAAQKWKLIDGKDGYLQFEPLCSPGYRLDLNGKSDAEGEKIQIYGNNNTDAQKWKLYPNADGSFQITNKATKDKKALTNGPKSTTSGQPVQSYTRKEGNEHQDWYFEPADEGTVSAAPRSGGIYHIRVRHSGQYIDVKNASAAVGTQAVQFNYNGGMNQQYRLLPYDGTYYQLEPVHAPGKVLAKSGTNDRGFSILSLETAMSGAANQLFRFEEVSPGNGYAIICKDGNLSLDVMDYSHQKLADIILTAHQSNSQVNKWWILEECSERMESSMTYTSDYKQPKTITDSRGNTVHYEYDDKNRLLTKLTDAKGNATSYAYDANTDKMTEVVRMVDGKEVKVSYTYENEKVTSISHNGFTYDYAYDPFGNLESVSIGGRELERTTLRSRNGLADRITYATGEAVRNEYNPEEQLAAQYLITADGREEKLFENTYDSCGKIARHKDLCSGVTSTYQYDLIGRMVGTDRSDGMKLRKVYDEKNRVKGYTYQKDRVGHEVEFLYGDVEKQQKPGLGYGIKINGAQKIAYEYDALGRVIRTHNHFSDMNTSTQEYTYVSGKEAGVTTNLVASVREGNRAESYTYDACGNVETMVERSADGSERKIRYYYDALNQLVREDNQKQNQTICYTYDVGGNMVRRDEYRYTENPVITEAPRKSDTFKYQTGGWRDQLRFYNGQAITYDAMGNPLQYLGMQMEWEKGHQLRHITGAGLDMYCMYNDSGKRIRKTVNGVTTDFYLDGSAILMQTSSDGSRIDFFYDDKGNVFAMKYQNEMYFYRKNLFGDILGILDSHGTELVKYEYNSWGKLLNLTDYSSNGLGRRNPFRFKGYYYDEELGMYYLNSRYYDPETGRFVNADDFEMIDGSNHHILENNLFAYCFNNPANMIDDTGYWPKWAANLVKVGIGALAIGIGVAATVATGGAAAPVLVASLKIAATSAVIGAAVGAGTSAINYRILTGSWNGSGKIVLSGAVNGAASGFMWGGISAGATFTTVASKGVKVQRIGKLKPTNKSGNGYRGVQYKNQRGSLKSFELHSPHNSGPHQQWHWQRNTWNPKTGGITGRSIRWTLFGRRF